MKKNKEFDYKNFESEAIEKLRSGKGLIGEGGALTEMIGRILQAAYEGEIEDHIGLSKEEKNRRNGYTKKKVTTAIGEVELHPPRDRSGTFEPQIIKKWDRHIAPELEQQILSLYSVGTSYADISSHLKRMYGVEYSPSFITSITKTEVLRELAFKSSSGFEIRLIVFIHQVIVFCCRKKSPY